MRLAIPQATLSCYLRNVVRGEGIREIARDLDVAPSTITRRVRAVEDKQTCPAWSLAMEALCKALADPRFAAVTDYDLSTVATALGTTARDMQIALHRIHYAAGEAVEIALADRFDQAVAVMPSADNVPLPKPVALSLLFAGLVEPQGADRIGTVRLRTMGPRVPSSAARSEPEAPARPREHVPDPRRGPNAADHVASGAGVHPLENMRHKSPSLMTPERYAVGRRIWEASTIDPDGFAESFPRDALGDDLAGVLWSVVVEGRGVETVERDFGWPSRSAKLVLSIALDLADRLGVGK